MTHKRALALVIEFERDMPPLWIWEALKSQEKMYGVYVKSISEYEFCENCKNELIACVC